MLLRFATVAVLVLGAAAPALAQQPAAAPRPPAPLAIPEPRYTTLVLEIDVARPAAEVWSRVGQYCQIAQWLRTTCQITSAGDPEALGAVRALNNGATIEMLVGRTDLSYTYAQPVRVGVPYNAYHGTLEAKPTGPNSTRLVYSFFYDTSMLADDAARATERANRQARFGTAMQNMKIIAEGGTLPPPPAPAAPR